VFWSENTAHKFPGQIGKEKRGAAFSEGGANINIDQNLLTGALKYFCAPWVSKECQMLLKCLVKVRENV